MAEKKLIGFDQALDEYLSELLDIDRENLLSKLEVIKKEGGDLWSAFTARQQQAIEFRANCTDYTGLTFEEVKELAGNNLTNVPREYLIRMLRGDGDTIEENEQEIIETPYNNEHENVEPLVDDTKKYPAHVEVTYYGDGRNECYYDDDGRLHCENEPAYIKYDLEGNVDLEEYKIHGCDFRLDGPQHIDHSGNSSRGSYHIFNEDFYDKKEFDDFIESLKEKLSPGQTLQNYLFGDIVIKRNLGTYISEHHYSNGLLHRLNGPASISYNLKGEVKNEAYMLFGYNTFNKEDHEKMVASVPLELLENEIKKKGDCVHCRNIGIRNKKREESMKHIYGNTHYIYEDY